MKKIGVFDSGIGGLSVANAIKRAYPKLEVHFVNDAENVPYGSKQPDLLLHLVLPILKQLEQDGCELIVIACNTVTTTLLPQLKTLMSIPLIGVEPMVEAAANLSESGVIAVCATPTTLKSLRYDQLKKSYAADRIVVEPDCSDWSFMIETNQIDRKKITENIKQACADGADVIVLGCTHYHWIEELIESIAAGRAQIIQPEQKIVEQLRAYLNIDKKA